MAVFLRTKDEGRRTRSLPFRVPRPKFYKNRWLLIFLPVLFWSIPAFSVEPFFVTIDKVELKKADGEWFTVIEPDRKINLASEEAIVSFFNNGRIPPGDYSNVRVSLTRWKEGAKRVFLERKTDYAQMIAVKNGSFVNVSFNFKKTVFGYFSEVIEKVDLIVDDQERIDGSDTIKIWS